MKPYFFFLSILAISENVLAQEPAADPCSKVTCSNHGNCVLKGGDPVCACFEGYAPDATTGLSCLPLASPETEAGVAQPPPGNQPQIHAEKQKEQDRWMKPRHSFGVTGGLSVIYVGEPLTHGGFSVFGDFHAYRKLYLGMEYQFFMISTDSYEREHWAADVRIYAMWLAFSLKPIFMWKRMYVFPGIQLLAGLMCAKGRSYGGVEEDIVGPIVGGDILAGFGVRLHPYVSIFMETKFICAWGYGLGGIFNFGIRGLF